MLLIEDDADVRELVRVALESDGYRVATSTNGREALDYLRSTADVCIILLDLMLPMMDGSRFRSAQLRDRGLAWIPVVVLSGAPDATDQARVIGARSVVPKPIDVDVLRLALRRIGCCRARPRPLLSL